MRGSAFRMRIFHFAYSCLAVCLAGPAAAQCPVALESNSDQATGYTQRGDRCEGLFRQPVATSAALRIVGIHRHGPEFAPGSGAPITVSVSRPPRAKLGLRILSTKPRQYYRLDGVMAANGTFAWSRDVMDHARIRLEPSNVKAVACEQSCETKGARLYPISIAEGRVAASNGITIWFRAGVDLAQLFVSVSGAGANVKKVMMANAEVLSGRSMPAGVAKDVFLTLTPGVYTVRATAVPKGDNAVDEIQSDVVVD